MSTKYSRSMRSSATGPFVQAKTKRKKGSKRPKSPISSNQMDLDKNEVLQKYPIYRLLKMAPLGLRPKRIPVKTVIRFIEEIYEKIGKLSKKKFQSIFREENGFGIFVQHFFMQKFDKGKKGGLKKCEHTIINFLYSIDIYKGECLICLLFGQLLAEMYGSDLTIFVSELRMIIQRENKKSLLKHLDKKPSLKTYLIPYKKIRKIIGVFLTQGTMNHSIDSFISLLIEKYPSVKIEYCLEYSKLMHFSAELFIHKRQVLKGEAHNINNVVFLDDYDVFKTQNMAAVDTNQEKIKEICKYKASELAGRFISLVMKDGMMENYHTAIRLKEMLTGMLRKKTVDLMSAACNEDSKGWFHLLLIESPSMQDKAEWKGIVNDWRVLSSEYPDEDDVTEFVKKILQNKKLVNKICKLIIYLTSS